MFQSQPLTKKLLPKKTKQVSHPYVFPKENGVKTKSQQRKRDNPIPVLSPLPVQHVKPSQLESYCSTVWSWFKSVLQ